MYFNASEGNREEALRSSKKALTLAPDLAESHVAAGMAHCMVKDYHRISFVIVIVLIATI